MEATTANQPSPNGGRKYSNIGKCLMFNVAMNNGAPWRVRAAKS